MARPLVLAVMGPPRSSHEEVAEHHLGRPAAVCQLPQQHQQQEIIPTSSGEPFLPVECSIRNIVLIFVGYLILIVLYWFFKAWLPDGYSQIFRSYVFGPSGFWTMAPLRYAAKVDPFLSWVSPPRPPPWCNPRKGRDQILPSGNLGSRTARGPSSGRGTP